MSGHTPSPWSVHRSFPEYVVPADQSARPIGAHTDSDKDRVMFAHEIAICDRSRNRIPKATRKANARLISAAPELLEALIALRDYGPDSPEAWEMSFRAIAKATQP